MSFAFFVRIPKCRSLTVAYIKREINLVPLITGNLGEIIGFNRSEEMVTVATLDGRAYYTITQILRHSGIRFTSRTPDGDIPPDAKLVVTTRKEREKINFRPVLCLEDLELDAGISKQRILSLLDGGDDHLIAGIDPGKRIGIAFYYQHTEVESSVHASLYDALSRITTFLNKAWASKKTVKIGEGDLTIANRMAEEIIKRFGNSVDVELVDERGTSVRIGQVGRGRVRDQKSAALIALRRGRRFSSLK